MKVPKFNWIPFDKNNPPCLDADEEYMILLRERWYSDEPWEYSVDRASPYGSYIDDFWDTTNDWDEGQEIEVIAYCELPAFLKESDLVEE